MGPGHTRTMGSGYDGEDADEGPSSGECRYRSFDPRSTRRRNGGQPATLRGYRRIGCGETAVRGPGGFTPTTGDKRVLVRIPDPNNALMGTWEFHDVRDGAELADSDVYRAGCGTPKSNVYFGGAGGGREVVVVTTAWGVCEFEWGVLLYYPYGEERPQTMDS